MEQSLKLKNIIEVALLTSGRPLAIDELQKLFEERVERSTIRMLLDEIKSEWSKKTMELVLVANGYRFEAKVAFSDSLMRLTPERAIKYSRSVMEVLAIIAYRQPVTRGDIEKIRGVSLNPNALRQLIEREWVEIIGQKEVPGRPSLYATTKYFLDDFGLKELGELPDINISKEGFSNDIDTPKLPENLPEDIND
ncbi:MAG: SMC-Scp complex subunit ScpB [Nitrosomonadales bacterium]|jgi:segregation and condensation protein B|nr:MAG: segregation and condensation protein B [Methylophilales bacterium BACL14 MAG-120910-bin43]KRP08319.1 MAG: segregation and condensation protein B [Methylophilales bacterium BACL14 MAG-120920-bin58]MBT6391982.1 SMC-Scp complex subunit ScpB [Nitrosomonadales bacterium]|tara:strand:- start:1438 stop:2022 length:585 start_codon:yes stop_codon:yes gene_type:complete